MAFSRSSSGVLLVLFLAVACAEECTDADESSLLQVARAKDDASKEVAKVENKEEFVLGVKTVMSGGTVPGPPSTCGRWWVLDYLGARLTIDQTAADKGNYHVGVPTTRLMRGLDRRGRELTSCPQLKANLTFWAALVSKDDNEEVVEPVALEPNAGECTWKLSFTPREERHYDLHVRTTWWNVTQREPAYASAKVTKGFCHQGDRLELQKGWIGAGKGSVMLTGAGSGDYFCSDLCTMDERCHAFDYNFTGGSSQTQCSLFGATAVQDKAAGNCSTGSPRSDRGTWQYLGGWNQLNEDGNKKNSDCHSQSHVWGSPLAMGPPAVPKATSLFQLPPNPNCHTGREPGRFVLNTSKDGTIKSREWQPQSCNLQKYDIQALSECFARKNIQKIHMSGDSMVREQFMALQKILVPESVLSETEFEWIRHDEEVMKVSLSGASQLVPSKIHAQVLFTNLDAHYANWQESDAKLEEKLQKFRSGFRFANSTQQRIFLASAFPHSLHLQYLNPPRAERFNALVERVLSPIGFRLLDAYNISKLAGNTSYDGLALGETAPVLTPVLLNMICGGSEGAKRVYESL